MFFSQFEWFIVCCVAVHDVSVEKPEREFVMPTITNKTVD